MSVFTSLLGSDIRPSATNRWPSSYAKTTLRSGSDVFNIVLHQHQEQIVILTFVDDDDNKIPAPTGITITDCIECVFGFALALSSQKSYSIMHGSKCIARIRPETRFYTEPGVGFVAEAGVPNIRKLEIGLELEEPWRSDRV